MNLLKRVACQVKVLLWSNDVDLLAVVESLANKGNILQTKESDVSAKKLLSSAKSILCLPVEGALSED